MVKNLLKLYCIWTWDTCGGFFCLFCTVLFCFVFLPFDEMMTELHLHGEKLTETVLHLNLGHFVVFLLLLFCAVLFCFFFVLFFSPLMRQWQNYVWDIISRIGGWGMNTKIIKTETLLHLNLEIFFNIYLKNFFFIYFYFYLLFIFYFQSSVSLMPIQLTVD
jgi:hypothetical protein